MARMARCRPRSSGFNEAAGFTRRKLSIFMASSYQNPGRFNEAATRRKLLTISVTAVAGGSSFNEAAGFTRRKPTP